MSQRLSIRREVVEYGSLPVAAWLSQADGISAVRTLLVQLSERTADSGTGEYCPILLEHTLRLQMLISKSAGMVAGMISLPALAECLDVPEQHAEVWLPCLELKHDKQSSTSSPRWPSCLQHDIYLTCRCLLTPLLQ